MSAHLRGVTKRTEHGRSSIAARSDHTWGEKQCYLVDSHRRIVEWRRRPSPAEGSLVSLEAPGNVRIVDLIDSRNIILNSVWNLDCVAYHYLAPWACDGENLFFIAASICGGRMFSCFPNR